MSAGLALLAVVLAPGPAARAARSAGPPETADLVKARLVAERAAVVPGSTLWVDLHLEIKPGWHVYWRNPGDSGLPTAIDWTLPAQVTAGAIAWPVPERFVLSGLGNYGYAGNTDLLVPITAAPGLSRGGTAALAAKASWLVCSDICIPGGATLALDLPVTAAAPPADPATATLFAAARRHIPPPAAFETRFAADARDYRLTVPAAAVSGLDHPAVAFFPDAANLIDAAATARVASAGDGGLVVTLARAAPQAGAHPAPVPATLGGVLVLGSGTTARAFAISANPMPPGAAAAAAAVGTAAPAWWQALGLAFVGGLILNLMPCVFPILSLKVLGLAGHAHHARGARIAQGIAYGVGVVASFAALGGLLLVLRAGGAAIGWGFQLQSPVVVGMLAYLMLAMGLSLSGVAEFGGGLAGLGGRFADRAGWSGSFFTGVLATIVATPCTAPFMGSALGLALVAPAALALGIFVALGLGLAAPVVLASVMPGLHRILPRPGAWMTLFKQLLAFPLYGTVAWLIWVLIQQVGPQGALAALSGLVLVGFAVWVYGRTRLAAAGARWLGAGAAAAGLAAAIVLAATIVPAGANTTAPDKAAAAGGLAYQRFTPDRLAALRAAHKPVFVDLTAAWCLTCLVNERTLDAAPVRRAFAAHGVVPLQGDWTRQDPAITRFLLGFGRSGVPLYLLYAADGGPPVVLPRILTPTIVLDALGRI